MTQPAPTHQVRYYDPKRGGVWTRSFTSRAEAEAFASTRRLYARPCTVETVVSTDNDDLVEVTEVTAEQIAALREESAIFGNARMVATCDRATSGDLSALDDCGYAIRQLMGAP